MICRCIAYPIIGQERGRRGPQSIALHSQLYFIDYRSGKVMVRGARNMASIPGATFLFIRAMSSRAFGKPRFARAIRFQFFAGDLICRLSIFVATFNAHELKDDSSSRGSRTRVLLAPAGAHREACDLECLLGPGPVS
jgi:hypothetical protein